MNIKEVEASSFVECAQHICKEAGYVYHDTLSWQLIESSQLALFVGEDNFVIWMQVV